MQIAQPSVVQNKANASADSASSTMPLIRTTQLRCGKPRTVTTDAAKVKPVELWQLGEMRFESSRLGKQERFSWKYVLVQNVNACRIW